uniref:7,8-dihydro-8-oxoguanine triphosphatase-like n=1 Tax=Phallusia mammillata TaxID=59560 RepID=A0A6F9DNC7_9ASCI|nr:7,8-dihydro-8-oxoguanine triphosphatase-like [Phallusia mammillata]
MRELQEECGLIVNEDDVRQIGMILFDFVGDDFFIEMNIFKTKKFTGVVQESEEMKPKWFPVSEIPFSEMWADDIDWYPIMLRDDMFYGHMKFKGHETILNEDITLVTSLKEMYSVHEKTLEAYSMKHIDC